MSYDYVLALVEECHRFEEKAYTRVSLEELVGNRKLIDEYAALLFLPQGYAAGAEGQRMTGALRPESGRGNRCAFHLRGDGSRCPPFSDAGEAPVGRFSLHP